MAKAKTPHKQDQLVEYGEKFLFFSRKHSVLIIAALFAIAVGIVIIYKASYDAGVSEKKAGDEMALQLRGLGGAASGEDAEIKAGDFQALLDKHRDKKFYPAMAFAFARWCYTLGINYQDARLLQRTVDGCKELLEKHPQATVTQMKMPGSDRNLVTNLMDDSQKAMQDMNSPEMAAQFDPADIYEPPKPEGGEAAEIRPENE